jgi:hypothetical protein
MNITFLILFFVGSSTSVTLWCFAEISTRYSILQSCSFGNLSRKLLGRCYEHGESCQEPSGISDYNNVVGNCGSCQIISMAMGAIEFFLWYTWFNERCHTIFMEFVLISLIAIAA